MNIDRVNSELKRQIALIIDNNEIKDPRLSGIVSVTGVETAKDLGSAAVYISVLNGDIKEVLTALKSASGYIRNLLKNRITVRNMPELRFAADNSIEYGLKMDRLIKDVIKDDNDRGLS
ncbi:MAG: 30S ribosome-binding factor RbfA [Clostridiales bacterium]|jgi:ribosome-binding factor A|nr:30S ribosome-binding factor RbfA [Clostridiales bacterium]